MALSANRNVTSQDGKALVHPIGNGLKIYKGALVKHNAAGYLAPCAGEAGSAFAGVALEESEVPGSNGAVVSGLVAKEGAFELTGSGFAQTDVGLAVYAADDATVQLSAGTTSLQKVGFIEKYISATKVLVRIQMGLGLGAAS